MTTVPTWLALFCVALTGACAFVTALILQRRSLPLVDALNPLRQAINRALIRGFKPALVAGWHNRAVHVSRLLEGERRHLHEAELLDAEYMQHILGRGYETAPHHMHALGWLAHSIGFDPRKYQG